MPRSNRSFGLLIASLCGVIFFSVETTHAEDLESLKVPVFRDRDGYGLAVTEYSLETDAELLRGESAEHSLKFSALLQPPDDEDVLCFASTMVAKYANDEDGKDMLRPKRRRNNQQKFYALLPSLQYKTGRGTPMVLCESELEEIVLKRSGSGVYELAVVATAILVKEREIEEVAPEVSRNYTDIGHGTTVRVSSSEIDDKGEMTLKLAFKHVGNRDIPVIDSVFALNDRGKRIGGGRWTNELELFGRGYDVEMEFPLKDRDVEKLEIVLATEYDIEQIEFVIEDVFQQ
ncbi:MAG: hypothetical protein AAGC72_00935 [Planctomycetota bacterium]